MFSELMSFLADNLGSAFSTFALFQIGDFNLLAFLVIFLIIDVLVSIFIIKLDNGISFGGSGVHYTYDQTKFKRKHRDTKNKGG